MNAIIKEWMSGTGAPKRRDPHLLEQQSPLVVPEVQKVGDHCAGGPGGRVKWQRNIILQ